MAPGPVSDACDPVFGTAENARIVRDALREVAGKIAAGLGERQFILDVAQGPAGSVKTIRLTERERRLIRYALLETAEAT